MMSQEERSMISTSINTDIGYLKAEVKNMHEEWQRSQNRVEAGVNELKTDIKSLTGEIRNIYASKEEVESLKSRVSKVEEWGDRVIWAIIGFIIIAVLSAVFALEKGVA